MRRVLVVGAGQSGLQLALGLQAHGYEVTVVTDRSPAELRGGRVMSTQCMFGAALAHERDLGLDFWSEQAPAIAALGATVPGPDGRPALDWVGRLERPARSVDQRIKMAAWLELFAERGGEVRQARLTVAELDDLASAYELVLLASGKGELGRLLPVDEARSPFRVPQRALALAYVHGLAPEPERGPGIRLSLFPGAGELITLPALAPSGPCDILFWEGLPGGPLDVFEPSIPAAEQLELMLKLVREFAPWEYERTRGGVELTDERATLAGRFTPVVRHPVGYLPSGRLVLGAADAVVANDPITGQGSNSASRCAAVYLDAVLAHGERPFDAAFLQSTFDRFWEHASVVTDWTNAMLLPPPPHVLDILGAAAHSQAVADRFAGGFDHPEDFRSWLLAGPDATAAYLASVIPGGPEAAPTTV